MQAITTKYLGPANRRGSRIVASCDAKKITVSWDHSLSPWHNHRQAAKALAKAMSWAYGTWVGGSVGGNYVWVCCTGESHLEFKVAK